jgi:HD-GYP domain-containing protein (c-di-GMP phosphodiesterase class II)
MTEKKADLQFITRLDSELSQIQDFDLLLERILQEARNVVHADAGTIYVTTNDDELNNGTEKLALKYSQNDTVKKRLPPDQKMIYTTFSLPIDDKSISGYCAKHRELINIPDMYKIPSDRPYNFYPKFDKISDYTSVSSLTIPLVVANEDRLIGVIQVLNATEPSGKVVPFTKKDETLLTFFAANATIALQRAYITRAMILRMIKMSELRDPKETGTHVNRVAGYSVDIYDRYAIHHKHTIDYREKFRDNLKIGSMLHDVGKVAISDAILKKPARFTSEEFKIMQNHTIYGASLFTGTQSPVDNLAMDIALTHHENWDGSGYPGWVDPVTGNITRADTEGNPLGRVGEDIPLGGRIVAIADVYDALCSKRVYKEPWTEEQVLTEMRKLSGTKFDPELIDIFFEILPSIKQTETMYPES